MSWPIRTAAQEMTTSTITDIQNIDLTESFSVKKNGCVALYFS